MSELETAMVGDEQSEEWLVHDSRVAGPCMTCGRADGLVVVRNGVRLCFTCAIRRGNEEPEGDP